MTAESELTAAIERLRQLKMYGGDLAWREVYPGDGGEGALGEDEHLVLINYFADHPPGVEILNVTQG